MSFISSVLIDYTNFIAKILRVLSVVVGVGGVTVEFEKKAQQSLDERIAKLDAAQKNLADGIEAIEQLKHDAERTKRDVTFAAEQLQRLSEDKEEAAKQLESIRRAANSDIDAFRQLAGVPTEASIRRERVVGFVGGVIASLVASAIIWGAGKAYPYLLSHFFAT